MTEKPPEAVKLPRRFMWAHPFWAVLGSLEGILFAAIGAAFYVLIMSWPIIAHIPALNPLVAITIGLVGGFAFVAAETWRRRRQFDLETRALAFGGSSLRFRLMRVAVFVVIVGATLAVVAIVFRIAAGVLFVPAIAGLYVPFIFLYKSSAQIHERARQLFLESSEGAMASNAVAPRSMPRWINPAGVGCVMAVLLVGAWLQWGVAVAAQREPRHFETKTDDAHGVATRQTYGNDASAPALSPNGRSVAYVRNAWLWVGRLEIMRPDGSGKRRLGEEQALSPAGFHPLRWSSDEKRILLVGDRVPEPKTWDDMVKEGESFSCDLWTVDVASGAARRLTDDDGYMAGMWLPATHRIAAIRSTRHEWARLWLMDERGDNRLKVANLKLGRHRLAAQPWHDGHDVVAVGAEDTAGIWLVDAANGKVTRLSDIAASWALPIAPQWLVIGVQGRAYPPFHRATSVGIFDTGTGKVHWVLRDIQGTVGHPCLVPKLGVMVFTLRLDEGRDVWALRLRDGQLRRLTRGESVMNATVDALGKTIFYQASNEECERFRGFNIGESIWRLDLGRPLTAARWDVWP